MRNTLSGGNTLSTTSLSSRAVFRSEPNGFSMTTRRQRRRRAARRARAPQLLGDLRERLRRDRQVERVVALRAAVAVELVERRLRAVERGVVVELALHEPDADLQLAPDVLVERGARVLLDRVVHLALEVLVVPVAAGEPDQAEPGRQQAAVREVVDRRHELLARQVAGDAEDDQRARARDAVEPPIGRRRGADCARRRSRRARVSRSRVAELLRDGARARRASGQRQHGTAVVGEHARVAGGLGLDQLPEGERAVGDLEVLAARRRRAAGTRRPAGRPCGTGPVECRKRGPQPKVTGRSARAASRSRRSASSGCATRSR